MRKTIAAAGVGVVLLLCASASAETTITLQQGLNGYAGTRDSWLEEANEQNYGPDWSLHIQYNNGISDATVLSFNLAGQIPLNQRILAASLELWYGSAGSMGPTNAIELKPYRVMPNTWWDEGDGSNHHGVNWEDRDYNQLYPWTSQYGGWYDKIDDGNSTVWIQDVDGEVPGAIRPSNWISFDVLSTVRQWYSQGQINNGFSLYSIGFAGNGYIAYGLFSSRDHGTQWSRPKLVITYEGALAPVADAGGPYTVGPDQSVIFDGSESYDPDGGLITAWLWDLDNDGSYDDASGELVNKTYDELRALGLAPGLHQIGLQVFDDEDESDTDTAELLILSEMDFGDAPDGPYATLLLNDGARHIIDPTVYLGWSIDREPDGQPEPNALGDDNHGIDDEDGVAFDPSLTPGTWEEVQVTSSVAGYLSAWIDFYANGNWAEPVDQIFSGAWIPGGTATLPFYVPDDAAQGATTFARFRFCTQRALPFVGEAIDGEVEDHVVQIGLLPPRHDLGDAPDSTNHSGAPMTAYPMVAVQANFPTVYESMVAGAVGPLHLEPLAAFLGTQVSLENEADIGADEDGVNNIDPPSNVADRDGADDGIAVPLHLPHCQETSFSYTVTVVDLPAETFYVNVWFDWNRDGDWDDTEMCPLNLLAPEWAVQNQVMPVPSPGQYTFTTPPFYPWHPSEPANFIWMRVTLSEQPWEPSPLPGSGGSGPEGGYQYGETEDYLFVPILDEACCYGGRCEDQDPRVCEQTGGVPQGPGTECTTVFQACCMPDGSCTMVDPICCDDIGGIPQGAGSVCTEPEACCLPSGICIYADPLCCDDLGGVAQGKGTACVDMTIACCLPSGDCMEVDPICCDDIGGVPGYMPHCLGDGNGNGTDDACELEVKWLQPSHQGGEGFDAASDLQWPEPPKWSQLPDYNWPGLHAHDYEVGPTVGKITLADDWICEGGDVIAVHWWGNYEIDTAGEEIRGAGIDHFHLSIHLCGGGVPYCLPMEPELLGFDVPFTADLEQPTGQVNIEGSPVYLYEFELPVPFSQEQGMHYWFDVTAASRDPADPPHWRWQEANRSFVFLGWAPAAEKVEPPYPGTWQSIMWPTDQFSDMAFRIISRRPATQTVNKVVADDFISDGRPIKAMDWFGSYFDERYSPLHPPMEPYVLDGWMISFHYDAPPALCPPVIAAGDVPSALGVYFAPVEAVQINPLFMADCFGHGIFLYNIDFRECCLLCSRADPRLPFGYVPAQSDGFYETAGLRYWLDIQAVVGVTWTPRNCSHEDRQLTGHVASPGTPDGHFWGWHTSPADFMPKGPLNEACTGRIVDFSPYPPECWDYGEWVKQPWLCDTMPPFPPVNMAFTLLAPPCHPLGDVNSDGNLDLYDIPGFVDCLILDWAMGYWCGCADMNGDYLTNGIDIQLFVNALLMP